MERNTYNEIDLFADFKVDITDSSLKLPLCLVLDKSGSMDGSVKGGRGRTTKIEELNQNVARLLEYISKDEKAKRICDICIVAFGGNVPEVIFGYQSIEKIKFKNLTATGTTPMGAAVKKAIDLLELRRRYYKDNGISHYKPILLLMSDGAPTDNIDFAAAECSKMVNNKRLKIYPVGIGENFETVYLRQFSPILEPKRIVDISGFTKLFDLLSTSSSNPNDDSLDKWFQDEL